MLTRGFLSLLCVLLIPVWVTMSLVIAMGGICTAIVLLIIKELKTLLSNLL
jgi:hypothetical protein